VRPMEWTGWPRPLCDPHEFYPGGRHEMLNETNRDEVRTGLIGWISSVLEHGKLYTEAS